MLVIRLQRIGKKHEPHYRLVVSEKREKLGAPPAEDLGSYNPKTKASTINKDRVNYWLQKGAQPSATVHNLLVREGILTVPKIQFHFPVKIKEVADVAAAKGEKVDMEVVSGTESVAEEAANAEAAPENKPEEIKSE